MHIAIIPARSGSKRIKNKNIKKFINEPIIAKTIKIVRKFNKFDKIYVSTNSNKIKKIAENCGAIVPFLRNKKLSGDKVITHDVIVDLLKKISLENVETVTCLYPTSVFIEKKHIIEARKILKKNKQKYVFSATKYEHPIQRAFSIKKYKASLFQKYKLETRTQDFISYLSQNNLIQVQLDIDNYQLSNFTAVLFLVSMIYLIFYFKKEIQKRII